MVDNSSSTDINSTGKTGCIQNCAILSPGLIVLAIIPIILQKLTSSQIGAAIGGTGILIVVGVALETYKQLEGSLATRTYKKAVKGRRR